jgi:ATP-dependent RNA helicase DDX27
MAKADEDLVFTLSDHENSSISDFSETESNLRPKTSQKRKRHPTNETIPSKKKLKRQANDSDNESTEDQEEGVKDDTLDPEFEFEIGNSIHNDLVEDFDGWGISSAGIPKLSKRGVDIDDLISRRALKGKGSRTIHASDPTDESDLLSENAAANEFENEVDADEDADSFNFEDEELLAHDVLGMNPEQDEEMPSMDPLLDDSVNGDQVSDDESIASPMAHPDDISSSASDAESQTSFSDEEESAKRAAFFAPEDPDVATGGTRGSSFQQFSLSRPILRGLAALSFSTPTPIQVRTVPIALQGLDVVGSAVTGSGKTAAFLLPILERLLYRPRKVPTTRVAILMPTRELAVQCHSVAVALAKFTDVTFAMLVGGFSLREQESILKKRPDVVIATPGRFIDHMRNSASFAVENIEILVLDEADRMLETGFEDELDEILKTIPRSRQTMLFSATMTETVDKLVRVGMNKPVRLSVDAKKATTTGLTQEFVRLRPGREHLRLATLCVLCTQSFHQRVIIFFRQKKEAHRVRILFGLLGLKASELHGSMSQDQRIQAVNNFRDGKTTYLLATDLASRGLDIKNVATVVNYEAPQTHEIYLHRVGRTARAGKSGRACTIAAEPDRRVVKAAVKSGRSQNAKIVSRAMVAEEVDEMHAKIEELENDIEEILKEEKEEKHLAQTETQLNRGDNLIKHEAEIMARPKRTWFESEKDKNDAKKRGVMELNGLEIKVKGEKRKLSNKDKKRLDARKERKEGVGGLMGKKALLRQRDEFASKKKAQLKKAKAKGKGKGKGPEKMKKGRK